MNGSTRFRCAVRRLFIALYRLRCVISVVRLRIQNAVQFSYCGAELRGIAMGFYQKVYVAVMQIPAGFGLGVQRRKDIRRYEIGSFNNRIAFVYRFVFAAAFLLFCDPFGSERMSSAAGKSAGRSAAARLNKARRAACKHCGKSRRCKYR